MKLLFKCITNDENDVEAVYSDGKNILGFYKYSGIRVITDRLYAHLFTDHIDHEGRIPIVLDNLVVDIRYMHRIVHKELDLYKLLEINEKSIIYLYKVENGNQ